MMVLRVAFGAGLLVMASYTLTDTTGPISAASIGDVNSPERLVVRGRLDQEQRDAVRTVLTDGRTLRPGEHVWREVGVPDGPVTVHVDLPRQMLRVFRGGHEIGFSTILYGAREKSTPPGRYRVLSKHERHRSNLYDADMPYTLRLTNDGIAIHASRMRAGAATHGCIGLPPAFAERLFRAMEVGEQVIISAETA